MLWAQSKESDIIRSNRRNTGHLESNIGKKIWKIVSDFGVEVVDSKKDYIFRINEMERVDKVRKMGRMEKIF